MADSRTLDDIEELLPDVLFYGAIAYAIYWVSQRATPWLNPQLYFSPINRTLGQFGDSWTWIEDTVDANTWSPSEIRRDGGRAVRYVAGTPGRVWNRTFGRLF